VPALLVACGVWAIEGKLSLARANTLVLRSPARFRIGWVIAVAVVAAVSIGAMAVLYGPLRAVVVALIPSSRAIYLFSALFYAGVIAFQLALQSAFTAWIAPVLLAAEREAGPIPERPRAGVGTWICRAVGGVLAYLAFITAQFVVADWWRAIDARVLAATPACSARISEPGQKPEIIPCAEVGAFRNAHPGRPMVVLRGAVLTLAFTDRDGAERTVEQFFTAAIAERATGGAAIRLMHDLDKPATVLPTLPPGLGAFLWGVVVVLGGGSLFLFRLPGAIRRRRIKRAAAAV
jgi:hypothetical protein